MLLCYARCVSVTSPRRGGRGRSGVLAGLQPLVAAAVRLRLSVFELGCSFACAAVAIANERGADESISSRADGGR